MAQVTFTCPHCGATNMTMTVAGARVVPREMLSDRSSPYASGFAPCGRCWNPVGLSFTHTEYNRSVQHHSFNQEFDEALRREHNITSGKFLAKVVITPIPTSNAPDHLPANVAKAFRSAERNFKAEDGEDAAAMLYRRAIDVAIKEKHPEIKGNLAPRIEKLVKLGLLPPSMKEWGDQIRLIGNDGAHEPEGVTRDELVPMRGFTEAFLRYFITIPFEVAVRRGEIDEQGNPISTTPIADCD